MNTVTFFFIISTVILSLLLWSCYKNGAPAREAKRAADEAARKEAQAVAKRQAEAQFAADVISVLEDIVSGRISAQRSDYGTHGREFHKFPSVKLLQDMKGDRELIERILGRADRTHNRMNDLENGLHEIHMTLRPYHPRSCPSNEFPVIRKG